MKLFSIQSLAKLGQAFFGFAGLAFLVLESYEVIGNHDIEFPWGWYLLGCIAAAVAWWLVNGFFIDGYLRNRITITTGQLTTSIGIEFGDLLKKNGWKAIAVNDFFDSQVDDVVISKRSLHGQVLTEHWKNTSSAWDAQVSSELEGLPTKSVTRKAGKLKRYEIGTAASAMSKTGEKFVFVAIGRTDERDSVTYSNAEDVILAVRGLLKKARACCANQPLFIPLIGSGLARTGVNEYVLLQLILAGVVEEVKAAKVTSEIQIVLPERLKNSINLGAIKSHWK